MFGGGVLGGGAAARNDPYYSSVKLLLRGEGASIVDDIGHVMETEGTTVPAISAAQARFGTSSIFFSGSNSTLYTGDSPDWTIGNNSYTVDLWFYTDRSPSMQYGGMLFYQGGSAGSSSTVTNVLRMEYGKLLWHPDYQNYPGNLSLFTTTIFGATWNHVALVRDGVNFKLYVNGVLEVEATKAVTIIDSNERIKFGGMGSPTFYHPLLAYIDHFRFTNGVARWTANFTPPTVSDY